MKKKSANPTKKAAVSKTPRLDEAIKRLRAVCSKHGRKTELAKYIFGSSEESLHVGQIKVAELLRQRYHPGAELLLAAREWAKEKHGIDILR